MPMRRKPGSGSGSGSSPVASTGLKRIEKFKDKFMQNSQQSIESEFSQISGYSDSDHTPIPSLHGNLVRTQHKRDPLEFYEIVEMLGEGSMGSVSKVRKRSGVIGGSARPDYLKKHSKSQASGWSPVPTFCPVRNQSKASAVSGLSSSINSDTEESEHSSGCWARLFAPNKYADVVLESVNEDSSHGSKVDNSYNRGWRRWLCPGFGQGTKLQSARCLEESLLMEEHEQLQREVERALRHSSSSMITYGHKDVVYALKSIHLDRVSSADFMKELKNEVAILKDLDHPNIVKAMETYFFRNQLFIVLELCSGGDLYTRDPYSEPDAARIVRAITSAVAYMHSKNISHRDLKYENIMFVDSSVDAEVKIIDFGLSKKYAADTFLHDAVGTVYTMAPELLLGSYTSKVDVWSVGVIAFMLLSSSMPFYGKDRKQVIKKIVKGQFHFISRRWQQVSPAAKTFVGQLLQKNPDKRPSAIEALASPWLNEANKSERSQTKSDRSGTSSNGSSSVSLETDMMDQVQATIQSFASYGKLKKLALMIIAYKSTSKEIGFLRRMFDKFDQKKDGELSLEEFKAVLADYEYSDEEIERMFQALDLDGTGVVHYSEFLAATIETHGSISEEALAEAFDQIDADDSGHITANDIIEFLGPGIPKSYVESILDEADLDHDNRISYEEFLALWHISGDEKMKKDRDDVKQRRLRRSDSRESVISEADFSDESDEDASEGHDAFEAEVVTPTAKNGRRASLSFQAEKHKSLRSSSVRANTAADLSAKTSERNGGYVGGT